VTGAAGALAVAAGAALVAYAACARLAPNALGRSNFRGMTVSLVAGPVAVLVLVAGALVAGGRAGRAAALAAFVAGLAGVYDDLRGDATARGLAGHLRALACGTVTSGALKILLVGLGGLAAAVVLHGVTPRALPAAVLVAGTANLLNLFDLRPGRALKVALLVALPLLLSRAAPVAALVAGAAAGLLPSDLRERTMLGDGGANALGAALGVALARACSPPYAVAAALAVVALTLASERVSFSRVIDRAGPLRWADRLGRAA
jgi:hypothetical protein